MSITPGQLEASWNRTFPAPVDLDAKLPCDECRREMQGIVTKIRVGRGCAIQSKCPYCGHWNGRVFNAM